MVIVQDERDIVMLVGIPSALICFRIWRSRLIPKLFDKKRASTAARKWVGAGSI